MADFQLKRNPETGATVFWENGMSDWVEVQAKRNPQTGEVAILLQGASEWRNLGQFGDTSPAPQQPANPTWRDPAPKAPVQPGADRNLSFPPIGGAQPVQPRAPQPPQPVQPTAPAQPQIQTEQVLAQPSSLRPQARPMVSQDPIVAALMGVDTTDDARAERGFGRTNYLDGLVNAPNAPANPVIPDAMRAPEEQNQPLSDLGSRFMRGGTEVIASLPEAAAIAGAGNPNAAALFAQETIQQAQAQIAEAEVRLQSNPEQAAQINAVIAEQRGIIEAYTPLVGLAEGPTRPAAQDRPLFQRGEQVRQASQDLFGTPDPQFDDRFIGKLAEGGGSLAGFVATTLLTGPVGGAMAGSGVNASGMYRRALADGATEEQAKAAAYIGSMVGASEVLPIGRALGMLPSGMRERVSGALGRRLSNAFATAGEEGVQEAMVEIANNLTEKGIWNPDQAVFEGAGESALIGAILGGGLGAIAPTGRDTQPSAGRGAPPQVDDTPPATQEPPQDADAALAQAMGAAPQQPQRQGPPEMQGPAQPAPPLSLEEAMRVPDAQAPAQPRAGEAVQPPPQEAASVGTDAAPAGDGAFDPAQWTELPGVNDEGDTGNVFYEHSQTGEVITKNEFDRRRAVQQGQLIRDGQVPGVSMPNAGSGSSNPANAERVPDADLSAPDPDQQLAEAMGEVQGPLEMQGPAAPPAPPRDGPAAGEAGSTRLTPQRERPFDEVGAQWDAMTPEARAAALKGATPGADPDRIDRLAQKPWRDVSDRIKAPIARRLPENAGQGVQEGAQDETLLQQPDPDAELRANLEGNEKAAKRRGIEDFIDNIPRSLPSYIDPTDETAANAWFAGWDAAKEAEDNYEATPENMPFSNSEAGNPGYHMRRWLREASDETLMAAPNMGLSEAWLQQERQRRKIGDFAERPVDTSLGGAIPNININRVGTDGLTDAERGGPDTNSKRYRWDNMSTTDRVKLLRRMDGTKKANGELNKTALNAAKKAWDDLSDGARTKINERWNTLEAAEGGDPDGEVQGQEEVTTEPGQDTPATPPAIARLNEFAPTWDKMNGFAREDLLKEIGAATRKDGQLTAAGKKTAALPWKDIPSGIQEQIMDRAEKVMADKEKAATEKRENAEFILREIGDDTLNAMARRHKDILGQEPYQPGQNRFTDMIAIGGTTGEYNDAFDPALNKAARQVFEEFTGQKLPKTQRDTRTFLADGAPFTFKAPEPEAPTAATDPAFQAAQDSGRLEVIPVTAETEAQPKAPEKVTAKLAEVFDNLNRYEDFVSTRPKGVPDGGSPTRKVSSIDRDLMERSVRGMQSHSGDEPGVTFTAEIDGEPISIRFWEKPTTPEPEVTDGNEVTQEAEPAATVKFAGTLFLKMDTPDYPKNNTELMKLAAEDFGGTVGEGAFSPKDAYEAQELALNLYVRKMNTRHGDFDPTTSKMDVAKTDIQALQDLLDTLPTQTRRDSETDAFQQFSTPPQYAYAVNWIASIKETDQVLEPSAGNGGIAMFAKNAGAKVDVNEIAERRVPSLRALGFDRVTTENAEQIANIWSGDDSRKYDVVVMNPPFSAAGSRGVANTSATGAQHLQQALNLLQPGGRLVAIMGHTFRPDNSRVSKFFEKLGRTGYTVQANVVVVGDQVYKKYGTSYDNRLLVIDKAPAPEGHETLQGKAETIPDLLDMMEGVRNVASERTTSPRPDGAVGEDTRREDGGEPDATGGDRGATEPQRDPVPDDVGSDTGGGTRSGRPSGADGDAVRPARDAQEDAGTGKSRGSDARSGTDGSRSEPDGRRGGPTLRLKDAEESSVEDAGGGFAKYRPSRVRIEGAKEHPMLLVESSAMATVNPPRPNYDLQLPENMVKKGLLSEAQLEQVVYAGAAHSEILPNNPGEPAKRKGYYIGDGTGVGKTREIAGIIADNWAQGRKKHILISKDKKLLKGARRDFDNVGMKSVQIEDLAKTKGTGSVPKDYQGVLFTTYSTLGTSPKKDAKSRIEQLVEWVGPDFDGTIIFDEAHLAGNALPIKGKRGTSKPSKQALAVIDLQNQLPNARVVYASATAATEVYNLAYADRLGLWGAGTPFPNVLSFVNQIVKGGIAAMEVVARDMKEMGVYMARGLSYEGVEYEKVEHALTDDQRRMYDASAQAWQNILANVNEVIADMTQGGGRQRAAAMAQFWSAHQRFFNQVLTSMQMPSVIDSIKADLKAGRSPVVQIVNTNEAATNRAIAKLDDDQTLDDIDITPRDMIIQFLENSFPTTQYEEYQDDDGNIRSRPVKDSKGNTVENAEAVALREQLIGEMASMMLPGNPLDLLIETFGPRKVAEVTGRTTRIVTKNGKKVSERRSQAKAMAEAADFQGGKRDVLIFSDAGGTGMDFHADKGAKNNKRRAHYIVQAGWRADRAIQGFGRTHRTNQTEPPIYKLAGTNLSGHKRFTSSIARRLDQLGALTKGQKDAGGGMFDATDNLENEFAEAAVISLFSEINAGKLEGFDMADVSRELGLNLKTPEGQFSISKIPPVPQFLNRLLNVTIDKQNMLFDRFVEHMHTSVEDAIERGEFTAGVEEVKHDGAVLNETKEAFRDEGTGATSEYRMITLTKKVNAVKFADLPVYSQVQYKRHRDTGMVYMFRPASSRTNERGEVIPTYHRYSPTDRTIIDAWEYRSAYDLIKEDEAGPAWDEAYKAAPKFREETLHMVTGALLPIWDRLPNENMTIKRLTLDDGRSVLGRVIPDVELTETLSRLGVDGPQIDMDGAQMQEAVMGGKTVLLSSGHKLVRRKVGGENRVEVISPPSSAYQDTQPFRGVFARVGFQMERINYKNRAFVPLSEDGAKSLDAFMQGKNITNVTMERDRRNPTGIAPSLAESRTHKALRRELDKLGLDGVELRFDPKLEGQGQVTADYWGKVGIVLGQTANPRATLGHEALHVFRHWNLFTDQEWGVLSREAKRTWLKEYDIAARYPDLTADEQIEEAIAEAFGQVYYHKGQPPKEKPLRAAMRKISQILKAIGNWARGLGLQTPDQIMAAFASGEVPKQRKAAKGGAMQKEARQPRRNQTTQQRTSGGLYLPDRYVWDSLMHTNGGIFRRLSAAKAALGDRVDLIRTRVQDRMLPVRRAQENIEGLLGGKLDEDIDVYLAEEMYAGRTGAKINMIDREFTQKIIQIIGKTKDMSVESVGEFLYARHARERNDRIAQINPNFPDGGSGMPTAVARKIIDEIQKGPNAGAYDEIAQIVDDMREWGIQERVDMGLMTDTAANAWRAAYNHYVPLKGWAETDYTDAELDVAGVGRGYNVRGQESRMAMGRGSEAFNPLIAAITQAQEVAVRAEKNRVGQHLYRLAKDIPSASLWTIKKAETRRVFNEVTGLVEDRTMSPITLIQAANEMAVKVDGKEYRITMHDPRIARAITSVGVDGLHPLMKPFGILNRYLSTVNTMLDPEFVIRNFARDTVTANINIQSKEKGTAIQKGMMKDLPKALMGAWRGLGGKADTEWSRYFREFEEAGGKVHFWVMENPEANRDELRRRLKREANGWKGRALGLVTPSTNLNPALAGIERVNLAVDNALRLSAFVNARRNGMSKQQAASLAKNLTVNFNRRGDWGSVINSAFLFANAAMQGSHIMLKAMKHRKVQGIVAGLVVVGYLLDAANAYLSEEDEDGELAYDKIPDWKNQMNLTIMWGKDSGQAATIWLPYGYNVFPYLGQQIGKVTRGVKEPGDAMGDLMAAVFGAFSPINGKDLQSTLTPTALDIVNDFSQNEDWLGRPIRPESPFADYGPQSYKYYSGASSASREIADALNQLSGGTVAEPGFVDISPEYIDHAFGIATGGAGRFVGRTLDTTTKLARGEAGEIEARNIPFYRSLQTDTGDWLDRERYYVFRDRVREARQAVNDYREAGQRVPPEVIRIANLHNVNRETEKQLRKLRQAREGINANDTMSAAEKSRRRQAIDAQAANVYLVFNRAYVNALGPQGE